MREFQENAILHCLMLATVLVTCPRHIIPNTHTFKEEVYFGLQLQKFRSMVGRLECRNSVVERSAAVESCSHQVSQEADREGGWWGGRYTLLGHVPSDSLLTRRHLLTSCL